MIPGEYILKRDSIVFNEGKLATGITVINRGDRPIQIGSHFHFYEVNKSLIFDRKLARGFRLNIPSGTAVRFEPGQKKTIQLVELGGDRKVYGFNGLVMGKLDTI